MHFRTGSYLSSSYICQELGLAMDTTLNWITNPNCITSLSQNAGLWIMWQQQAATPDASTHWHRRHVLQQKIRDTTPRLPSTAALALTR
jgi:hypothetical protein